MDLIRKFVTVIAMASVLIWQIPAGAIEAIPEAPGWGGFVLVGAGYLDMRSNFVSGNGMVNVGNSRFESLGARPLSDDRFIPVVTGEINYSFGGGWQGFFGTSLEDAATLDGVTQLGLRKDLAAKGAFQAGFIFSGVATETWEDPYAEGVRRERTDRDSKGLRLQWDRVMGSPLELTFTYREISIDEERSGSGVTSVPCDLACQKSLVRDGEKYSFDVSYLFRLGAAGNHLVRPRVRYTIDDRDGDALAGDSLWLQISHAYVTSSYTLASNVAYGEVSRDAINPVVGVKADADRLVIGSTLLFRMPALGAGWQGVVSVLWGKDDSSSRFHDSETVLVSLGVLYRFGSP